MQRWGLTFVASCLVGVLMGPVIGASTTAPQDIDTLQTQYREAQREIERLRQALTQAQEENTRLRRQLAEVRKRAVPDNETSRPDTTSYRDAIAALTRQIDAKPQQAELYIKRGTVYAHLGEYERALDDLNRAISLEPQAATTYNQRGVIYYQRGQYAQALQDFNQAIEQAPRLGEAYHNRGIAYQTLGDYPQAYADLRQAEALGLAHAAEARQALQNDVRRLQAFLRQAGLAPGPTDGVPGAQTVAALQAYQRRQGLPVTGRLDTNTQQALGGYEQPGAQAKESSEILSRFVKRPTPPYPIQARQQGWEGKVTLRFEMLADGTIGTIEVVNSSGHSLLDSAARDTLKTWVHRPIVQNGQAVTQWATLDFEFKLEDNKPSGP